jgi:hypothetical protein
MKQVRSEHSYSGQRGTQGVRSTLLGAERYSGVQSTEYSPRGREVLRGTEYGVLSLGRGCAFGRPVDPDVYKRKSTSSASIVSAGQTGRILAISRCKTGGLYPCADVEGVGPVPVQMCQG